MPSLTGVSRGSVLRAIAECEVLGRESFLAKYGFDHARDIVLVFQGQKYDSKAIMGAAYGFEHPHLGPLTSGDFTGGKATVKRRLESLGFRVDVLSETGEVLDIRTREREPWTVHEYLLVGDLYLRRGRTVGTSDAEVQALAELLGRSPGSISRRVGNFEGTEHPGRGLKPITGAALDAWERFKSRPSDRENALARARASLSDIAIAQPRFVHPAEPSVEPMLVVPKAEAWEARQVEAALVQDFKSWIDPDGKRLTGIEVRVPSGATIRVDLFDIFTQTLIEAKAESSRNHLRLAVGQLFDYSRYLEGDPALAVLVPTEPSADLMGLLHRVKVLAVWRTGGGFADSENGRLLPA